MRSSMYHPYRGSGRLYRSRDNVFCGVCAGIAEAFDFSPWGVRIVFLLLQFTVVPFMFIVYIVLACLMRKAPYYPRSRRWDWE